MTLEQVLAGQGLLSGEQLAACRKAGGSLGPAAIAAGLLTGRQLLDLLALPLEEPIEDFVPEALSPELARLLPGELAVELQCLPVHDNGSELSVAFANEVDELQLERLSEQTGREIQAFLTEPQSLEAAYGILYGGGAGASEEGGEPAGGEGSEPGAASIESLDFAGDAEAAPAEEGADDSGAGLPEMGDLQGMMSQAVDAVKLVEDSEERRTSAYGISIDANSPPVVKLVNGMLIKALNLNASDIHVEPQERELRVRVRIDGDLHQAMRLPRAVVDSFVSRLKLMAGLDIVERRVPQDGRFKVQVGGAKIEFRMNSLPSAFGEKVVIRVLGGGKLKGEVKSMGFCPRDLECVQTTLKNPWGMILVTGPTGSGKTTSLYTMLKSLNTPDRNVVTAEDPIEYNLPGLTQVPVNPAVGLTFELALRAFLRQDPDVILVGEIRDKTTAEIGIKAAMTGHMVLSTLHTNSAPATILRLKNIGVDPFLVASAVKLVIAQRLVKLLCPHCKVPATIPEADKVGLTPAELAGLGKVYRGRGCGQCNGIGAKGRRPVFEVMPVASAKARAAVLEPTDAALDAVARQEGMRSLRENALTLAAEGVISFSEALRVGVAGE